MDFERLLALVGDEPVFETAMLMAGDVKPAVVRLQLARWVKAGKLYQLRRGLYALAPPYQKVKPHPFVIANHLVRASYVSLQSALAYYGLIPESVPVTVSVTTARPNGWETPLGSFEFRHLKPGLFRGYRFAELGNGQRAFIAAPEKALLDLVHLQPGGDSPTYLKELRLQNLNGLSLDEFHNLAESLRSPKIRRAAETIADLAHRESLEFKEL